MRSLTLALQVICVALAPGEESDKHLELSSVVISAHEQVDVPSRERGPLISLDVEEGDSLEAGRRIALVDDADARLAVERARITLESARKEAENLTRVELARKTLELARSELARGERSRSLVANAITAEEIALRKLAVDRAELEVAQAEHTFQQAALAAKLADAELRIAERNLSRCQISGPIPGIVAQVRKRTGEWVEPGQPVVRLVRLDRLRAEGFLAAHLLSEITPGCPVVLTIDGAGKSRKIAGELRFISPETNPVDGRVRVWASIENADLSLRPGMRATMKVQPQDKTDKLTK